MVALELGDLVTVDLEVEFGRPSLGAPPAQQGQGDGARRGDGQQAGDQPENHAAWSF